MIGKTLSLAIALTFAAQTAWAADVILPSPIRAGGNGVFSAIEGRSSAKSDAFPTGPVSEEALSTLLWAASGRNRAGGGWTIPSALGKPPYVTLYLAGEKGAYLYDPGRHALKSVNERDVRGVLSPQYFVGSAPYVLIFAIREQDVAAAGHSDYCWLMIGAMAQNVYLAAESLSLGVRYMASVDANAAREELGLARGDKPVAIMPIGARR